MDLSNRLVNLAKRTLPVSGAFDEIIRSIGECKSKGEEDIIMARVIDITRQKLKERSSRDIRTLKEVLVYLMYIEMLGHETSWAQAAVIQLCSEKNLAVKKMAYLATSLLVDPASELSILVTATIQADLKSDNFLVVCTALQAICHIASAELVNVFLPQITALLRHDRDLVKKKALLVLQRFVQLDPGVTHDVEKLLVEKIGYKEPSVMVASLCGLHDIIRHNPKPYRNLTHYFTNILKQAAEGKLGRSYEYHRAPAPFVQMELLRLLALLGAGDKHTSENIYAVVAEVKRRAEPLGNNIGNALVYECLKTIATIYPSPILIQQSLDTVARFLAARENNLKYAGIDTLTRLVRLDAKYAADHQYAVVDCLRSPDATLKKKTLELLYKMAGPANIEVIAREVVDYLRECGDEVARGEAVAQLADLAERYAPDHQWFVDTINELFEVAGEVVPSSVADDLMRLIGEGTGEDGEEAADCELRAAAVETYLDLLDRPKLPALLLKVICWVVGEYGTLSARSVESIMDKLAAIPDTQAATEEVRGVLLLALGKLSAQSGRPLTHEAQALLSAATASGSVELQQRALEVQALLRTSPQTRRAALPHDASCEDVVVDPNLPFLEAFIQQAIRNGAAPYLSLEDRLAFGVTRSAAGGLPGHDDHAHAVGAALKFQAYEKAAPPGPKPIAGVDPFAASSSAAGDLSQFAQLNLGGLHAPAQQPSAPYGNAPAAAAAAAAYPAAAAAPAPLPPPAGPQLLVNKPRKWGGQPQFTPAQPAALAAGLGAAAAPAQYPAPPGGAPYSPSPAAAPTPVDVAKQRLAASLFGGGGGSSASPVRTRRPAAAAGARGAATPPNPASQDNLLGDLASPAAPQQQQQQPAPAAAAAAGGLDLLFDVHGATTAPATSAAGPASSAQAAAAPLDPLAALSGLDVPPAAASVGVAPSGSSGTGGIDLFGGLGDLMGPGMAAPQQQPLMLPGLMPGMGGFGGVGLPQQVQQPMMGAMGMPQQPPTAGIGGLLSGGGLAPAPGGVLGMGAPAAAPMSAQPPKKKDPFADLLG